MRNLALLICLLCFSHTYAQRAVERAVLDSTEGNVELLLYAPFKFLIDTGMQSAAVITLTGDTVQGKIEVPEKNTLTDLETHIRFITKAGNLYVFTPNDIQGYILYHRSDTIYYESVYNDLHIEIVPVQATYGTRALGVRGNKFFFRKIVANGYYSLYYVVRGREHGTQVMYVNKDGNSDPRINQSVSKQEADREDPKSVGFSTLSFYCVRKENGNLIPIKKKVAPACFSDNHALMEKISTEEYDYHNMDKLVREYNEWKAKLQSTEQRY